MRVRKRATRMRALETRSNPHRAKEFLPGSYEGGKEVTHGEKTGDERDAKRCAYAA
jgi:hypothetical protein